MIYSSNQALSSLLNSLYLFKLFLDFYNEDSKTNFPLSYSTRFITNHYLDRDITINELKESSYLIN